MTPCRPPCLSQKHEARRAEAAVNHAKELEDVKKNEREAIEVANKAKTDWRLTGRCAPSAPYTPRFEILRGTEHTYGSFAKNRLILGCS